jgi:hypothetical protein
MGRDTGMIIGASALALLMLGGAAFWFLFAAGGNDSRPPTVTVASTAATPPPLSATPMVAITSAAPVATTPPRAYWPPSALGSFDPKRFDPETFLPTALADARKVWKDAALVWLSAVSVSADGSCDLTAEFAQRTATSYAFRSPIPKDAGAGCVHFVYVDQKGAWSETIDFPRLCKLPVAALSMKRRCSVAQAFAVVPTKYTVPTGARADVLLWTPQLDDKGKLYADWDVSGFPIVAGDAQSNLSWGFPDECPLVEH